MVGTGEKDGGTWEWGCSPQGWWHLARGRCRLACPWVSRWPPPGWCPPSTSQPLSGAPPVWRVKALVRALWRTLHTTHQMLRSGVRECNTSGSQSTLHTTHQILRSGVGGSQYIWFSKHPTHNPPNRKIWAWRRGRWRGRWSLRGGIGSSFLTTQHKCLSREKTGSGSLSGFFFLLHNLLYLYNSNFYPPKLLIYMRINFSLKVNAVQ